MRKSCPVLLGDANLHVNVSVEITDELFHPELKSKGSEMFRNKSSWLETQVSSGKKIHFKLTQLISLDQLRLW